MKVFIFNRTLFVFAQVSRLTAVFTPGLAALERVPKKQLFFLAPAHTQPADFEFPHRPGEMQMHQGFFSCSAGVALRNSLGIMLFFMGLE